MFAQPSPTAVLVPGTPTALRDSPTPIDSPPCTILHHNAPFPTPLPPPRSPRRPNPHPPPPMPHFASQCTISHPPPPSPPLPQSLFQPSLAANSPQAPAITALGPLSHWTSLHKFRHFAFRHHSH